MNKDEGLGEKFVVYKLVYESGSNIPTEKLVTERCFVMIPSKDPSAVQAMKRYAQHVWTRGFHRLANDIDQWMNQYGGFGNPTRPKDLRPPAGDPPHTHDRAEFDEPDEDDLEVKEQQIRLEDD